MNRAVRIGFVLMIERNYSQLSVELTRSIRVPPASRQGKKALKKALIRAISDSGMHN
jgi:hypothetical protein